jgi:hypothetical protein
MWERNHRFLFLLVPTSEVPRRKEKRRSVLPNLGLKIVKERSPRYGKEMPRNAISF